MERLFAGGFLAVVVVAALKMAGFIGGPDYAGFVIEQMTRIATGG